MGELVIETFQQKTENDSPYILNEELEIAKSFDDLNLKNELLKGIFSYGYVLPSPIQELAIKPIMNGRDIIAQSQSGTGKTATFIIGMLEKIDVTKNETQATLFVTRHPAAVYDDSKRNQGSIQARSVWISLGVTQSSIANAGYRRSIFVFHQYS